MDLPLQIIFVDKFIHCLVPFKIPQKKCERLQLPIFFPQSKTPPLNFFSSKIIMPLIISHYNVFRCFELILSVSLPIAVEDLDTAMFMPYDLAVLAGSNFPHCNSNHVKPLCKHM